MRSHLIVQLALLPTLTLLGGIQGSPVTGPKEPEALSKIRESLANAESIQKDLQNLVQDVIAVSPKRDFSTKLGQSCGQVLFLAPLSRSGSELIFSLALLQLEANMQCELDRATVRAAVKQQVPRSIDELSSQAKQDRLNLKSFDELQLSSDEAAVRDCISAKVKQRASEVEAIVGLLKSLPAGG